MINKTVMDIFCGAGGFSAGFHLNGFQIKHGIDSWQPAMNTFNYNYGLKPSTVV
ncbi:MAG: DNA cytosine methyltransferase [Flavobacteriaceae bacterium]|nr:DNA cytosine methyltransferase [Flavobacteriaceae bacterium]